MAKMLTPQEFDRVRGMKLDGDAALERALAAPRDAVDAETLAALGADIRVGSVAIPQPTLAVLPLLELIESPFMGVGNGQVGMQDLANIVYILVHPQEAAQMLGALPRRRAALKRQEDTAKTSPDLYRVYLAQVDQLEGIWAEFEARANATLAELGITTLPDMQDACAALVEAMSTGLAGFQALPKSDATEDKKKI